MQCSGILRKWPNHCIFFCLGLLHFHLGCLFKHLCQRVNLIMSLRHLIWKVVNCMMPFLVTGQVSAPCNRVSITVGSETLAPWSVYWGAVAAKDRPFSSISGIVLPEFQLDMGSSSHRCSAQLWSVVTDLLPGDLQLWVLWSFPQMMVLEFASCFLQSVLGYQDTVYMSWIIVLRLWSSHGRNIYIASSSSVLHL